MRRREKRFSFTAEVRYEVCPTGPSSNSLLGTGEIENIASGGLRMVTKDPLHVGQIIKIDLPMPDSTASTPTLTEICWIRPLSGEGSLQVGLRYIL